MQERHICSPGVGGRDGAAVRNDRYSQGLVTIFFSGKIYYLNIHLSYSKSLLLTLSESESKLFTGDTSNDNYSPGPVIREVRPYLLQEK